MSEVSLYDSAGTPAAYIDMNDEQTIYAFSGEPLAYLDSELCTALMACIWAGLFAPT